VDGRPSVEVYKVTYLIATYYLVLLSMALLTTPYAPFPGIRI